MSALAIFTTRYACLESGCSRWHVHINNGKQVQRRRQSGSGKQGLLGKVSRFQSLSQRANKSFPDTLSPIEPDVEAIRLEDQTESQPSTSHKEHD